MTDIFIALEWIHNNIAAFGGDNRRITLVGHTGGAALVNYLLISSISKGKTYLILSIYTFSLLSQFSDGLK